MLQFRLTPSTAVFQSDEMKYSAGYLLVASSATCGSAFYVPVVAPPISRTTAATGQHAQRSSLFSKTYMYDDAPSSPGGDKDTRLAFLEKASVALGGGVLAWSVGLDGVLAVPARPSARGLAETSIQLIGTSKQPIAVSVLYPKQWTVNKMPGKGISIQDYKYTDRAFSLSTPLPAGKKSLADLPVSFFTDVLFDLNGPYGNYGKVDDFKVIESKMETKGKRDYRYVDLKFAALTQGLLQVGRRACVASTIVGDDVVIFTASVLASRWDKVAPIVGEMIESYRAEVPQKTPDPSSFAFNRR